MAYSLEQAIQRATDRINLLSDISVDDEYRIMDSYKVIRELSEERHDAVMEIIECTLGFTNPTKEEYERTCAVAYGLDLEEKKEDRTVVMLTHEKKGSGDIMKHGFTALWNYQGLVHDMGMEADQEGKPCFYIMTDDWDFIQVSLDSPINIGMVRCWLEKLNTSVPCVFLDYKQFQELIHDVFRIYADRQGKYLNYDNTLLNGLKESLHLTDKDISTKAGVGRTTVNDLTRGLTKHPKFYTVGKIHSAIHTLWKERTNK